MPTNRFHANVVIVAFALFAATTFSNADGAATLPYLNDALPVEVRVQDLMSRMTVQEKCDQLDHSQSALPRLGIPAWHGWNQAIHGVWTTRPTTNFPVPIALAATWDRTLVRTDADAISDEGRALYNIGAQGSSGPHGLVYRSPVINISRNPLWGRIQECYGEDPTLTGTIGVAFIEGLQGDDRKYLKLAATVKHFAVNNQENGRLGLEATVPERSLYEFWLPHWKMCIQQGKPQSVMAAYNGVNGLPCAINPTLLITILRDQWGFDGFVVSDLGGIKHLLDGHHLPLTPEAAAAKALLAGCDADDAEYSRNLPLALQEGLIKQSDIDTALSRVLRVAFRLGVFDPAADNRYNKITPDVIDSSAHRQLALKTAQEAMVLLKNDGNFLPLNRSAIKSVAVIGPCGARFEPGSYYGVTPVMVSPIAGLQNRLGPSVAVTYTQGCGVLDTLSAPPDIASAVAAARVADVVVLCLGTNPKVEAEARDRTNLDLPGSQEQLLEAVVAANPRTVVVLFNGGPLAINWANAHAPAIIDAFYPGEEGGDALADILLGNANPSGRLPYTVYASANDVPPMSDYDASDGFTYKYFAGKPLFAFGSGLSYTQFSYGRMKVDAPKTLSGTSVLTANVLVRNTGAVAGDDVVQVYAHETVAALKTPIHKLVAFRRIHLEPGQVALVQLDFAADKLAFYNVDKHAFQIYPGVIDFTAGSSSVDPIAAKTNLLIKTETNFAP